MSEAHLPGRDYQPEREFPISDIESLKVYFDPTRLRIIQQIADHPRSIHEIADALGMPFTRLYYHINLLEKHGLIKLVEIKHGAGAIEEKYYRITAWFFNVSRSLMTPGTPGGDQGLETVLKTVLDDTHSSIYAAIDAGVLDPTQRTPNPNALVIARGVFSLSPELAMEFQARLRDLLVEFNSRQLATLEGTLPYNLAIAFHPTVLMEEEHAPEITAFDPSEK